MTKKRPQLPAVRQILLLLAAVLVLLSALLLVLPAATTQAAAPSTVTVSARIGTGGTAVALKTYTLAELSALGVQEETYTVIDGLPSVVIANVRGIYLETLFADVGISTYEIQRVNCYGTDGKTDEFTGSALFERSRYRYNNLQNNYYVSSDDEIIGVGDWAAGAEVVRPMLSLAESWTRVSDGGDVSGGNKYTEENLGSMEILRIHTGMVDLSKIASTQTYWIDRFVLTLYSTNGTSDPTLSIDGNKTDSSVGDSYALSLYVDAGVFENQIRSDVQWTSSDESIATVDSNGVVTIVGEGEATITATSASFGLKDSKKVGTRDFVADPTNSSGNGVDDDDPATPSETSTPVTSPDVSGGGGTGGGSGSGSPGGLLGDSEQTVPTGYIPVDLNLNDVIDIQTQRGYALELGNGVSAGIDLETDDSNPLLAFTGAAAGVLFVLGGLGRGLKYINDIGGFYVLRRKSI